MDYVTGMPLSHLRVYERWASATLGTLLQIAPGTGTPVVGMLCKHPDLEPRLLLGLDGSEAGKLLSADHLGEGCGIDVTHFVELYLQDPAPVPVPQPKLQVGLLYSEMGVVSMWCEVPNSTVAKALIPLSGNNRGLGVKDSGGAVPVGTPRMKFIDPSATAPAKPDNASALTK